MSLAVVSFSGGLDSTVALAIAVDSYDEVVALSADYGQRHTVELDAAARIAARYGVRHHVVDLTGYGSLTTSSLTSDEPIPHGLYDEENMASTVVPARNAVFAMIATGLAESLGGGDVILAVHGGDHAVYADCRPGFLASAASTARLATDGNVTIDAPFIHMSKTDIVKLGATHHAPLGETWSCYEGGQQHCGRCGTCTERKLAFHEAGVPDPTEYVDATLYRHGQQVPA